MTDPAPDAEDRIVHAGRTRRQLVEAFELVKPKPHWKGAVDAVVPHGTDLSLVDDAIGFFTGGVASTSPAEGGTRVRSKGYWHHIGA